MSDGRDAVPFRWDVARREQLGRLPDAPLPGNEAWRMAPRFGELLDGVRELSARVAARAGDARLVFVGRSLENVFDYLAGALADTPWAERCDLLSVSFSWGGARQAPPHARDALRAHLRALRLSPAEVASAPCPLAMVDLVAGGGTFGLLSAALVEWAREDGVDPAAVRRRLRWVGVTVRTRNSPNTWRWFQRVRWAREYPRRSLRGISVDGSLWGYLGDRQVKTMPSNHLGRWDDEAMRHPSRDPEHLRALRLALRIHERARTREERARLAALLARRTEMREPWLRALVLALRRG